jgi:hypothetical protein
LVKCISAKPTWPASKCNFVNDFNLSGGWDKDKPVEAESEGHEIYNWAISEPATFPVFFTVNLAVISISFSPALGSDTSRFEYWKVVYDKPCL